MKTDYSDHLIKEYQYWKLEVYSNQGYLGRCAVWCKRASASDPTDATPDEQRELFQILQEVKVALSLSFAPDWYNYAFQGNKVARLHCHVVPRYRKPVTFMGKLFEDARFGTQYVTDWDVTTPQSILYGVRDEIKRHISL
ncbi:MAG: HIT domain-containing protein [bacterium]